MYVVYICNHYSNLYFQFNENSCCSWMNVSRLYDLEKAHVIKKAPQLSRDHIYPKLCQKMRVKLAAQVLSHRTAAAIRSSAAQLASTAGDTADLIEVFNNAFDFLNSSNLKDCRTRRHAMIQVWSTQ